MWNIVVCIRLCCHWHCWRWDNRFKTANFFVNIWQFVFNEIFLFGCFKNLLPEVLLVKTHNSLLIHIFSCECFQLIYNSKLVWNYAMQKSNIELVKNFHVRLQEMRRVENLFEAKRNEKFINTSLKATCDVCGNW